MLITQSMNTSEWQQTGPPSGSCTQPTGITRSCCLTASWWDKVHADSPRSMQQMQRGVPCVGRRQLFGDPDLKIQSCAEGLSWRKEVQAWPKGDGASSSKGHVDLFTTPATPACQYNSCAPEPCAPAPFSSFLYSGANCRAQFIWQRPSTLSSKGGYMWTSNDTL